MGITRFYFCDLDGNWWEIVAVEPGGYANDYEERLDLTGRHDLDHVTGSVARIHTHDPEFRAKYLQPRAVRLLSPGRTANRGRGEPA